MAAIFVALLLVLPPFSSQPASAAVPTVHVDLLQESDDSSVGTNVDFTANVNWTGGAEALEPPNGWYVNFHGTADGGWDSGPIWADDGEATYTRTTPIAQTETVTATIVNTGCTAAPTASATVTHRWWQPTITLDQENTSTPTTGTFQLTGTVTRDGTDPVANAEVSLSVLRYTYPPGSYLTSLTPTTTTNGTGRFSIQWDDPPPIEGPLQPGIEAIYVHASADGGNFSADEATSHSWTVAADPVTSFTVTAAEELRVGDDFPVTANYPTSVATTPPPDFGFATGTGWQNPNPPTSPATTTGTSTITYDSATQAGWLIRGARWSANGPHASHATYWYQPQIAFREPASYSANFDAYRSSVIVTDGRGEPIPNFGVTFYDGETEIGTTDTNAEGIATSDPLIRTPGTNLQLTARETSVPSGNVAASANTTHSWISTPLGLNFRVNNTSEGFESRVGTSETFRAHLDFDSEGADNLRDWDVRFTIDGQPIGTRVTDEAGNASISTTRTTQSFSYISATVNIAGCGSISSTTYHEWWQPVVDLKPEATVSLADDSQTFTAELSRPPASETGGDAVEKATARQLKQLKLRTAAAEKKIKKQADEVQAAAAPGWEVLPDHRIRFTLTSRSCELPVEIQDATTNQAGIATASFTRNGPTVDRVRASEIAVTAPQSDTTTHTWAEPPNSPISVDLSQSSTKSQVGSTVTFRAEVHDSRRSDGLAAPGTKVVFHGISPNRTRTTNSEGVAELDFTGSGTSPDTLTATTAYGCGVVESDPVTHEWERPATETSPTPTVTSTPAVTVTSTPVITTPPSDEPTPDEPTPTDEETTEPPPPSLSPTLPATSKKVDGPEVGRPGADIEISGSGCKAGESLTVSLGATQLGQTRAAADGTFYVRAVVPDLPLGRYVINSSCGKTDGDPNVDITSPQVDKARAGIAAAGLTTASTFAFFVLLAKGVISFLPRRPN